MTTTKARASALARAGFGRLSKYDATPMNIAGSSLGIWEHKQRSIIKFQIPTKHIPVLYKLLRTCNPPFHKRIGTARNRIPRV